MKSFSASLEVLYPPLIGPPLTLTSLLMATSLTKSTRIVENLFPLTLAKNQRFLNQKKRGVLLLINLLILHGAKLSIGRSSDTM